MFKQEEVSLSNPRYKIKVILHTLNLYIIVTKLTCPLLTHIGLPDNNQAICQFIPQASTKVSVLWTGQVYNCKSNLLYRIGSTSRSILLLFSVKPFTVFRGFLLWSRRLFCFLCPLYEQIGRAKRHSLVHRISNFYLSCAVKMQHPSSFHSYCERKLKFLQNLFN